MVMGMIISFADSKLKNEYNELIQSFINTEASFKFYNTKANGVIEYDISKEEISDICLEITNNLGLEESNLKWEETIIDGIENKANKEPLYKPLYK